MLSVIVWEHPELTIPAGEFRSADSSGYPVGTDGSIFFPHVGLVQVAGHTPEEVRKALTAKLSRVVQDPQLQVLVASYRAKRAQIAGEVMQPSPVPITDVPLRVQDAIALARGFSRPTPTRPAPRSHARARCTSSTCSRSTRGATNRRTGCSTTGTSSTSPIAATNNRIFVLGEVVRPSTKLMPRGRMTLADAIGDSEGLAPIFANPAQILVFRGRYDAPEIYQLDASSPDALLLTTQFQMQPMDVVFVGTYNLARFNRVVSQLLPTVQGLWQIWSIGRTVGLP